jgi:hypothetical protein
MELSELEPELDPSKQYSIVLWLQSHQNDESSLRILDPTCGSGSGNRFISFNIEYTVRFINGAGQLYFLYGHFLYGIKFIVTFYTVVFYTVTFYTVTFYTVQNLYCSKFIRFKVYTVQNLYGHFLYGSKFIQFKIYTVQNLYCRKRHNQP